MQEKSVPCRFCAIIRGELPAWEVFRDDACIAFLDLRPLFPGHTLLIPRMHVETLPELNDTLVGPLFITAQLLARAVQEAAAAEGTFIAINNRVSQSVPHLHVHIVPRRRHDGLRGFFWPRRKYADDQAAVEMQKAVKRAISSKGWQ